MFPKTCEWHLEWLSYGVYKHVIGENDISYVYII